MQTEEQKNDIEKEPAPGLGLRETLIACLQDIGLFAIKATLGALVFVVVSIGAVTALLTDPKTMLITATSKTSGKRKDDDNIRGMDMAAEPPGTKYASPQEPATEDIYPGLKDPVPAPGDSVPADIIIQTEEDGVSMDYIWDGMMITIASFSENDYLNMKAMPRRYNVSQYNSYIAEKRNREVLKDIASKIQEACTIAEKSEREKVESALSFVQSIPYMSDMDSKNERDYPKYPIETLFECCGDCEDKCMLLSGILKEWGYKTVYVMYGDHVALAVGGSEFSPGYYFDKDGERYYFMETTLPGWHVGEMPDEYAGRTCDLVN